MTSFSEMNDMADKVNILLNRAGLENGQITLKKAEDTIGRGIFWQLPNDYRTMSEVRNNGVPLFEQAPKAPITQSYLALADALSSDEPEPAPEITTAPKKSGLGRLFNLLPTKTGK
jgi:pilus assembly protein CpaE